VGQSEEDVDSKRMTPAIERNAAEENDRREGGAGIAVEACGTRA
jgi:hypothetical protein